MDKKVRAFNSKNGDEVWSYELPYIGSNPPTVYSHKNEQYVLITSTGSLSLKDNFLKKLNLAIGCIVSN